jgi:glycosidase
MRIPRLTLRLFIALVAVVLIIFSSSQIARAGDNNILWDYLYHSGSGYNPLTETVPTQSFTFLDAGGSQVLPTTTVNVYILTDWMDLTSAQVRYWDTAQHFVSFSWVMNITTSFHGTASHKFDLWKASIPPHAAGTTIWYRVQATDGTANAWLKAPGGGTYTNPLSQSVRSDNVDPGDYSYTVASGSPTATPTNTATSTATATRTSTTQPTNTFTPTFVPPTATVNPSATATQSGSGVCAGRSAGDGNILSSQVFHDSTQIAYRNPLGSIQVGSSAVLTLRVCQNDVSSVQVMVWKTGDPLTAPSNTYSLSVSSTDPSGPYDLWSATVPAPSTVIDQWYQFKVTDGATIGYYEVVANANNTGPGVWSSSLQNQSWKLGTATPPPTDYAVPSWMKDAVIYQIFPDRFRNGDTTNDPTVSKQVYGPTTCNSGPCNTSFHTNWNDLPTTPAMGIDFFGGDLQGVTNEINAGYFNDLGVNVLYFTPIFEASSNHGYDTNDYYNVAARFGGNAAFDTLMTAANAHGLRVVLDGVWNHTGSDSKYMDGYGLNRWPNDVGACESASSPYRAWFQTGSQGSGCAGGWQWSGWYGYETIPLVQETDAVKAFFYRDGSAQSPNGLSVSHYWISKGVSGWRYDAIQSTSLTWVQDQRNYVKTVYGTTDTLMLGEVTGGCDWNLAQQYVNSKGLDSFMNYCFRDWVTSFGNGGAPSSFDSNWNNFRALFGNSPWHAFMNLVSSHDSPRVLNNVSGDKSKVKLIVLMQMTLPGAPSVYYGDEVGLPGGGDPDNRRTYPWADKGGSPDTTMYAHFKKVIGIRAANSALRGGDMKTLLINDTAHLYSYLRWDSTRKIVVAVNNSTTAAQAVIPVSSDIPDGTVLTDLLNGGTVTVSGGNVTVTVNGMWGVILATP